MKQSRKEKVIVAIAAVLFFAAFGTIALMDRSHGFDGEGIGANDVDIDVGKNEGHISMASVPDDLMIFPAGEEAKVNFRVENNDRDNDIDTIEIRIPGSTMENGTSQWYLDTAVEHEWDYSGTGDTATFEARDDLMGRVFGGSAQYDVVGNIDDALDHFEANDTIPVEVSEAVTVTTEFITPSSPGIKYQNQGMQVQVGDMKTEATDNTLTPLYPDGYPYMVIDDGYTFIVIRMDTTEAGLEVQYGTSTLFSGSRAISDYRISGSGIMFTSDDGNTYAILEAPGEGVAVKPVIVGKEGATVDEIQISLQEIRVDDVTASGDNMFTVIRDNSTSVPGPEPGQRFVDTDGDFIYDVVDDDIDGDGIPNDRDPEPLIPGTEWVNDDPVITSVTGPVDKVKEGEVFTIQADAEDPDGDPITYEWTVSGSAWTDEGESVTIPDTFEAGTYTFTVIVSDDKGGSTSDTIVVEIYEEEEPSSNWWIYVIVGLILLVIIIVVVFYLMKKGEDEDEVPEEIPPQEPMGGYEEPEADYEQTTPEGYNLMDVENESLQPPISIEETIEEEEVEVTGPGKGSVPIMEDEQEGQIPSLPGDSDTPEIQDLEQLIDEMEQTEEEVGDVCPECSSPLGPDDTECPSCGAQFELAMECPNCGSVIEEELSECPNCGVSFM